MILYLWLKVTDVRVESLEQAFQWHEMYCHDLEVMSSNSSGGSNLGCITVLAKSFSKQK